MNKIEVKIEILSYAKSQIGNYVIVLADMNSNRKLPIIIKAADAQFIAIKLEGVKSPRPMTQDLFRTLTDAYNIDIQEIYIYKVSEGVFYAKMSTSNMFEEDNLDIECTIGDALAMAVLYSCPIFVSEEVMNSTSVDLNTPAPKPSIEMKVQTKKAKGVRKPKETVEDLDKLLNKALEDEDYESAVELRDKIAKLKKA